MHIHIQKAVHLNAIFNSRNGSREPYLPNDKGMYVYIPTYIELKLERNIVAC